MFSCYLFTWRFKIYLVAMKQKNSTKIPFIKFYQTALTLTYSTENLVGER